MDILDESEGSIPKAMESEFDLDDDNVNQHKIEMTFEYEGSHAPSKAVRTVPLICCPRMDAAAEGGSAGVLDILSCHFRPLSTCSSSFEWLAKRRVDAHCGNIAGSLLLVDTQHQQLRASGAAAVTMMTKTL